MSTNTARNFRSTNYERAADEWYVEPRWCVEQLLDAIDFCGDWIWDPCCGGGTIPDAMRAKGHNFVLASDIVDRGYHRFDGVHDATAEGCPSFVKPGMRLSIATNPPFKIAETLVRRWLPLVDRRLAILQSLQFLASRGRYRLFTEFPPSEVLVLSQRPSMPPGHLISEMGDKAFKGGTTDFCWIVWTKPHDRETRVRWLEPTA